MDKSTPLIDAARRGSTQNLKRCLDHTHSDRCDPMDRDSFGFSALMMAALNGHEDCVRLLLPHSDPLAVDVHGRSALMWAAMRGHEACVKILLPASDLLAQDFSGLSASYIAKDSGHVALAEMIHAYTLALSEAALMDRHVCAATTGSALKVRL